MNLHGKKVLITGAARGIGKAIVLKFAASGAHVAFTYLKSLPIEIEHLEARLLDMGVSFKGFQLDTSDFAATHKVIQDTVQALGGLDVLINNAGITKDNLLLRMSEADWSTVLDVNLKSAFNTVKGALPTFLKQRSGSIINISSVVGMRGNVGQSNYAASKAGIIGFTKSIALELGSRNIRANAIAPGFIDTAMTSHLPDSLHEAWTKNIPLKRIGLPEDVANCALFLASDASSYITGQVIQVDGGMYT